MHQPRLKHILQLLVFTVAGAVIAISAAAQSAPDNTKVNTRDRAPGAVTADQQKEDVGDRELARKIRQSLVKDKALSTYAHNLKVVAQGGHVTLKGPVRSAQELRVVEAKAAEVAGPGNVVNEMSVAPPKRPKT